MEQAIGLNAAQMNFFQFLAHIKTTEELEELIFSLPLYILFRKSPNIPDMRFSELLIALVYTYNVMLVYQIVIGFFRLPSDLYTCTLLLPVFTMKQLSGFPWWRTILYVCLTYLASYYLLKWGIAGAATLYAEIMLYM